MAAADLKARIVEQAKTLGFDSVRVTRAELSRETGQGLDAYIAAGHHGDMDWLAHAPERRRDPRGLWPEARSVIVLGTNYGPAADPAGGAQASRASGHLGLRRRQGLP